MMPTTQWPFRQDNRAWSDENMWDRDKAMEVHQKYNGATKATADEMLRQFPDGNTIGNEGCLLTCLAMVLCLLDEPPDRWSPRSLNTFAQENLYYTPCGLSMATLYADLVCEASEGNVQLLLKEEYLSGQEGWPPTFASDCLPVRAFRALSRQNRRNIVVMIKIGTYDDTVGSHFLLIDQAKPGSRDEDDLIVLDPAEPLRNRKKPWLLSDSCRRICSDPEIQDAFNASKIQPLQLAGVWVFARWLSKKDKCLAPNFLREMVASLSLR